jgi:hypothetical protein
VSYSMMRERLGRGWLMEEILAIPSRVFKAHDKVTIEGETKTLLEWCAYHGLTYSTLNHRLARGWPLSRLFIPPRPTHRAKGRKHRGLRKEPGKSDALCGTISVPSPPPSSGAA